MTETYNDPFETSKPPRKKQKRGTEPKNRSPRPSQQTDGSANMQGGSPEHGEEEIESGGSSDANSGIESETGAQPMAPVQRLSTLDPSKSKVLSQTETEWTVRLHPNDVRIWPVSHVTLQGLRST